MPPAFRKLHLENENRENRVKGGALANSEVDKLKNLSPPFSPEEIAHPLLALDTLSQTVKSPSQKAIIGSPVTLPPQAGPSTHTCRLN